MGKNSQMPTHLDLLNPLLDAMHALGGSGTTDEINKTVGQTLDLPEAVLNQPHDPERTSRTEVEYRLAWARNYLKHFGILENSSRGIWAIRPEKQGIHQVDPNEVGRVVRALLAQRRAEAEEQEEEAGGTGGPALVAEEDLPWRQELYRVLTEVISPEAFERLSMRLLRESGFTQVEVTGRSGDGGIDGKGIMRIGGLLSFHVIFQCKRYQGAVSAGHLRDFRGAMVGRADKGLFITTGTFTRDAVKEATRDGAPPIDLVDGEQLADKLKELGLGVKTEKVERVSWTRGGLVEYSPRCDCGKARPGALRIPRALPYRISCPRT